MTTDHPITPPPELVEKWAIKSPIQHSDETWAYELFIAHEAARWGADQELEACCQHLRNHQWGFVGRPDGTKVHTAVDLQLARRPKPPSLKEQALEKLAWIDEKLEAPLLNHCDAIHIIRRALESLPD